MQVSTYLTFDGNCLEAMTFYKEVFKCDEMFQMTWKDTPMAGDIPEDYKDKILHSSIAITKSTTLMASDRDPNKKKEDFVVGTNSQICLAPTTKEETDALFAALSKGGVVEMPPKDSFWGAYHGSCTDKFGVRWMFDCANPSKNGTLELTKVAASLRDAAELAIASAEKLEKSVEEEPPTKKSKVDDKE